MGTIKRKDGDSTQVHAWTGTEEADAMGVRQVRETDKDEGEMQDIKKVSPQQRESQRDGQLNERSVGEVNGTGAEEGRRGRTGEEKQGVEAAKRRGAKTEGRSLIGV